MTKSRLIGLDLLKVVAAFTVVLIHTTVPNAELRQSCLAVLPPANDVFAMMSGYFLFKSICCSKMSGVVWLKRRAARLLVPYLIWEAIYVLSNVCFDAFRLGGFDGVLIGYNWVSVLFFGGGSAQLWFVISLFYAQVLLAAVCFAITNLKSRIVALAILTCGFVFGRSCLTGGTPLSHVLFLGGMCGLGMMLAVLFSNCYFIPIVTLAISAFVFERYMAIAWVGVFLVLSHPFFDRTFLSKLSRIRQVLITLSGLTMGVYLIHVLVGRMAMIAVPRILGGFANSGYVLPIVAAITFAVSVGLVWLGRNMKWLWGE